MSVIESDALRRAPGAGEGRLPGPGLQPEDPLDVVLRRLNTVVRLDDEERELVRDLTGPPTEHRVGADLGDDGDAGCRLLLSGWACRVSETPWGGRQVLDFVLPGDAVGLSIRPHVEGLYRVVAITRGVSVDARLLRERLRGQIDGVGGLRLACINLERAALARMISHTSRLGGASATQAMAHLLLELRSRQAQIGMLQSGRFPLPLSQECLHEALGITVTQVYRILTQLRRDGLIVLEPGWCAIPDPALLAAAGGFKQWRD